jgi:hypothetical protein
MPELTEFAPMDCWLSMSPKDKDRVVPYLDHPGAGWRMGNDPARYETPDQALYHWVKTKQQEAALNLQESLFQAKQVTAWWGRIKMAEELSL